MQRVDYISGIFSPQRPAPTMAALARKTQRNERSPAKLNPAQVRTMVNKALPLRIQRGSSIVLNVTVR